MLTLRLADTSPKLQVFGNLLLAETGGESLPEWILLQVSIFILALFTLLLFHKLDIRTEDGL